MDFKSLSSSQYFLWSGAFFVVLFTVFKSDFAGNIGFFTQLLFWALQVSFLLPLLIVAQRSLQAIASIPQWNPWVTTAMAGALAAVVYVPFAMVWDYIFGFEDWAQVNTLTEMTRLALNEAAALILPVTIAWLGVNAPRILQLNFQVSSESIEQPLKALPDCPILALLPKNLGVDIVYIASELHYIRVVTLNGEALILYSLKNAVAELADCYPGIQTHRSYWVNTDHIERLVGTSSSHRLLTKQGFSVPVSRRQLKTVKTTLGIQ